MYEFYNTFGPFDPFYKTFSAGCFYSTAIGELRCYENPKNKITAVPATEEEIWGAKFMVSLHNIKFNKPLVTYFCWFDFSGF